MTKGSLPLSAAFWAVFGFSAVLLVAWALDRSGDPATRGLGRFYALVGLPFLGLGLLLFLVSRATLPRLLALPLAGAPLLALGVLFAFARFGYLLDRYLDSPGHRFTSSAGRALGEAVERGDLERIRALVASGADPNAPGKDGLSPLAFALDRQRIDAAALLLDLGADPTRGQGAAGRPPLISMAATDALNDLLDRALRHGAPVDFVDNPESGTLVHWAIASRAPRNLDRLLAAGARLDTRDDAHVLPSPLSYAIERRLWDYARRLVEHGAPLHEAPGYNGLAARFANAEPPGDGDADRADYVRLVEAMRARGFTTPPMPGGAPPPAGR